MKRPRRDPRTPSDKLNSINVHVGHRIRLRRVLLGMSQEKLAKAIGLTLQQVQKYERGATRLSASRLFDLSHALAVPISFFFDDIPEEISLQRSSQPLEEVKEPEAPLADFMLNREAQELVRAYYRITDPQVRRRIYDLTRSLALVSDESN
nr:helix-turn-helix transcriptional regulator [Telmatospirillum sp. J64-1]